MSLAFIDAVSIQHACSAQAASSAVQLSIRPNPARTVAVSLCRASRPWAVKLHSMGSNLSIFSICVGLWEVLSVLKCVKWRA